MAEFPQPARDLVVVVRAFNEAPALGGVLVALLGSGAAPIVVDDGSVDGTAEVARALGVQVVRHAVNLGPGAALQTGFVAALRLGARYVVTFDADGQHSIADLPALLTPLRDGSADVVFGSRFLRREDRGKIPPLRRALLRGAVVVNYFLTGGWLSDAHNGMRALTRDAASRIELSESGFAYASELLSQIRRHRLRLREVPVTVTYSERSLAKGQRGWNAINVLLDLLSSRLLR